MTIFNLLSLFGGLAMFLYGMSVMGNGLEKFGGGRFESILSKLTSNPVKGVMLGLGVTAIIQSSSATTVMVVGFVNSGIMKLHQAIGIIMGANIGTTVTAWILSLSGIQGDGFFIQMLKPINFTPVLAFIGIALLMFAKSDKKKNIGDIFLGFSILMFGMNLMSTSVEPLKDVPQFANILTMFSNPILGVLAGALLTAIIQSSSASVGILQALSATGAITFGSAIPIILGQNIGTCATALISCIGTSKNAKRAAVVHLYFNIIGTIVFLTGFYILNAIFKFSFVNSTVNEVNIAIVHTIFNISATILLLPFNKVLETLAKKTVKDGKSTDAFGSLDERFLLTPQVAIGQCVTLATNMSYIVKETVDMAVSCMKDYNEKTDAVIIENEQLTDDYQDALENYLVKLSAKNLTAEESLKVSMIMHAVGDFEQMADYAVNILHTAREKKKRECTFSEKAKSELKIMAAAVDDVIDITIAAFSENNIPEAIKCEPLADVVSALRKSLKKRHIHRMQEGVCTVEMGFVFTDYITAMDKIADHCQNIGISVIQMNNPEYELHGTAHEQRRSDSEYKDLYAEYIEKYELPYSKSEHAK